MNRIVIVGGGMAGGNAVTALRDDGFDGEIVLFAEESGPPFGRPPLSKTYLRDEEDLSAWLVKPEEWYEQHDVTLRHERVTTIDASGRRIVADGGSVDCDALCIATGCRPRRPRGAEELGGVFVLRSKADADAIKGAAHESGAKCVVVGMSFIGAEVAASLRQIGVEVTAIFPGPGPMASALGERVARVMSEIHADHGVELVANEKVSSFRGNGSVEEVMTESGRRFSCTFVVAGIGVEPDVALAEAAGITVDNGILVDARCETNVPGVFAAGDVANHDHPLFGRLRVEHYNNAEKQGRHIAKTMLGQHRPYDYMHTFWSDQYENKLEYVGHAKDFDDFVVRGDVDSRVFLGFYLKDGYMQAAMGLNRGGDPEAEPDSELAQCTGLIEHRVRVDAAALSDEDAPLRP